MKTITTKLVVCVIAVAGLLLIAPVGQAAAASDLEALEDGLRETDAIGFTTKLSLKSRIESLIDKFRDFHAGEESDGVDVLEAEFSALMDHTLALVWSDDPALFQKISAARQELWITLSNPVVFVATMETDEATFLAMRSDR